MTWAEAGSAPFNNITGTDPLLVDPENGDYRVSPGSPAAAYGCRNFTGPERNPSRREPHTPGDTHSRRTRSIEVSGIVSTDTVWDADTVRVVGDVTIAEGVTLSLLPGTRVEFQGFFRIVVLGNMIANGTLASPIFFTHYESWMFSPDDLDLGCWNGIEYPQTRSAGQGSLFRRCVFEYSKALNIGRGGVFRIDDYDDILVENCVFRNNHAVYGGVVYLNRGSAPVFSGCLFTDNTAAFSGSVLYNQDSWPRFYNNTIVGNTVQNEDIYVDTGALHNHLGKILLVNNIIFDNSSAFFGQVQIREGKTWYTRNNCIENYDLVYGNIHGDPFFTEVGTHPFSPDQGSPCIDSGTTTFGNPPATETDLAGHPRVYGTGIDMGAYEFSPVNVGDAETPNPDTPMFRTYPNPFNPEVNFGFDLEDESRVLIRVYDIRGRKVATVVDRIFTRGQHTHTWSAETSGGTHLSGGVYLVSMEINGQQVATRKILLLK